MKITHVLSLLFLWSFNLQGQTIEPFSLVSNANYYDLSVQGVSLHTSFGELATETLSADESHLSQGFLQTYFEIVLAAPEAEESLRLTVGPNPFTDFITIAADQVNDLEATLFDLHGRPLQHLSWNDYSTTLDGRELPVGSYFLRVSNSNQTLFQTIKLIKL